MNSIEGDNRAKYDNICTRRSKEGRITYINAKS